MNFSNPNLSTTENNTKRKNATPKERETRYPHSPFLKFERTEWAQLYAKNSLNFPPTDLSNIRSLQDPIDPKEVEDIYFPLIALIRIYFNTARTFYNTRKSFTNHNNTQVPFIIGIAGSVAVGKSTAARLLQELLGRLPEKPKVDLVTTDGFLYPNSILKNLDLMQRKGFPDSYDRKGLLNFISAAKSGEPQISAPIYSHLIYDIIPDEIKTINRPDILIVEGLNVLSPPRTDNTGHPGLTLSDFFDFSIYLDAEPANIKKWYIERFHALRSTAFSNPKSYFHKYANLSDKETTLLASNIWDTINSPNLEENILPTRERATIILSKNSSHLINKIMLRKA